MAREAVRWQSTTLADLARVTRERKRSDDEHVARQASYVREAVSRGASWSQIGEALGVSKQAAHERWSAGSRNDHETT